MKEPRGPGELGSEPAQPEASSQAFPFAAPVLSFASLATADVGIRGRMLSAMQRSTGNQSIARALLREPAPPADAPVSAAGDAGVDAALLAMLDSAWPDTTWAQGRMILDLARVVPGLGALTGLGADLMTAWDDVAAVPTGDPVIAGLTDVLIVVRSGVSTVSNGAQALLELGQFAQYALGTLTTAEGAAATFGGVTAPAAVITGLQTLTALIGNTAVGFVLAETDGVLIWLDGLITFDATIWANIGPVADRDEWADVAWSYAANTLGDIATLPIAMAGIGSGSLVPSGLIAQAIDSITAVVKQTQILRKVITAGLKAFWNANGGAILEPNPGSAPSGDGGLEPGEPQGQPGSEIGFDSFSVARAPADDPATDAEWRAARSVERDARVCRAWRELYRRRRERLGGAARGRWRDDGGHGGRA